MFVVLLLGHIAATAVGLHDFRMETYFHLRYTGLYKIPVLPKMTVNFLPEFCPKFWTRKFRHGKSINQTRRQSSLLTTLTTVNVSWLDTYTCYTSVDVTL